MAKRTSKKQVAANRGNAKKSTGPKTSKGKEIVRFNAVKHGMTALSPVISVEGFDECPEEFNTLHEQLVEELSPAGKLENLIVHKIAAFHHNSLMADPGHLG
jgi:hypothetical protein